MRKWQYSKVETIEIETPDEIDDQEKFLDWLSDHPDSRTASFSVVDMFVSEAHEIEEE